MVFWLCSQILEDRLLPVTFHVIPIINHTMADRIMDSITRRSGIGESFVADKEVKIFDSTFRCEMSRF